MYEPGKIPGHLAGGGINPRKNASAKLPIEVQEVGGILIIGMSILGDLRSRAETD